MVELGRAAGAAARVLLLVAALVRLARRSPPAASDDNRNKPAPAGADQRLRAVGASKVTASPGKFGAGPITLLVSNQSGASQHPHDRRARG